MKVISLACFVCFLLIPFSCDDEYENPVPSVFVDFFIRIDNANNWELNSPGGSIYYQGGYKGVIIYRVSMDEFMAFDMACPYHPFEEKALVRVVDAPLATDTLCGSTFLLLDGSVITGPSQHPLRQYRTFFDYPTLQVTN